MSDFLTTNNESAIAPWGPSLEPIKAITGELDPSRVLTGGLSHEVNIPTLMLEAHDNIILPETFLTPMPNEAVVNSDRILADSSFDSVTGQAMSEVDGDLTKLPTRPDVVAEINLPFEENRDEPGATALAEGGLNGDFRDPSVNVVLPAEIIDELNGAFAAAIDTMVDGDLIKLPTRPDVVAEINLPFEENREAPGATALAEGGFNGDFSEPSLNVVWSAEIIDKANEAFTAAVADVLPEEIGPSVDLLLNVTDALKDEASTFWAVV